MLEGRDDLLVFSPRCVSLDSIIVCGNKPKLLEAYELTESSERDRIVFIADCDYDVPSGRLSPGEGLILTKHTDIETDLVELGIVRSIALRAVPSSRGSDDAVASTERHILEEAIKLAETPGQLRHLSAVRGLGLKVGGLQLRRYRDKASRSVSRDRIIEAVRQRTSGTQLTAQEIGSQLEESPSGCRRRWKTHPPPPAENAPL